MFSDSLHDAACEVARCAAHYQKMDFLPSQIYDPEQIIAVIAHMLEMVVISDSDNGDGEETNKAKIKGLAKRRALELLTEEGFKLRRSDRPLIK